MAVALVWRENDKLAAARDEGEGRLGAWKCDGPKPQTSLLRKVVERVE